MIGSGRRFEENGFFEKLNEIEGYVLSDVTKFPEIPLWKVSEGIVRRWYHDGMLGARTQVSRPRALKLVGGVRMQYEFALDGEERLTLDELTYELERWHRYNKETIVDEYAGVPVLVNEFWTAKQRAAHSLHEISYRACFKAQLPRFFITRLTDPGDVVFDPFMGRGTTLLEAAVARAADTGERRQSAVSRASRGAAGPRRRWRRSTRGWALWRWTNRRRIPTASTFSSMNGR